LPYLIDASNLGGALAGPAGARDAAAVVALLTGWARERGRVVAVFDGEPSADVAVRYGPLEIVWSGAGRSADAEIVRRLARGGRDWIVVTNDRELARRARERGARVEAASDFAARISRARAGADEAGDAEKPRPTSDDEAHWRRVFGDHAAPRRGAANADEAARRRR
jgi:hypothetical protein